MIRMSASQFLKKYVIFGEILPNDVDIIDGDLNISNMGLTNLHNIKEVNGYLICNTNNIESLDYVPKVSKTIDLSHNEELFEVTTCCLPCEGIAFAGTPFYNSVIVALKDYNMDNPEYDYFEKPVKLQGETEFNRLKRFLKMRVINEILQKI